jgi:hypothetical protein
MMPENVPNIERRDTFWHYAGVINSYDRLHERCRIARAKYDIQFGKGRFRRMRRYRDPRTGEIRKTVEVWI